AVTAPAQRASSTAPRGPWVRGGAEKAAEVHDGDGDAGQLGRVHLAADRPRQHEHAAKETEAEEEGGHRPERSGAERAEEERPHAEERDAQGDVGPFAPPHDAG